MIKRATVPAAVVLVLCFLVAGCGRQNPETKLPDVLSKSKKAYAYVPVLMTAHPLYNELAALEQHIGMLRGTRPPAVAEQITQSWEGPFIVPPALGSVRQGSGLYRQQWLIGGPRIQRGGVVELPGDLQARLSWEINRIDQEVNRKLQRAYAQESQRLAQVQIEAMRSRQLEVSRQELDQSVPADEAAQKAQQLRRKITEEALAEEVRASEARLAALHQTLDKRRREALVRTQQQLQQEAQQRRSYRTGPSGKLQEQLSRRIEEFPGQWGQANEPLIGPAPGDRQLLAVGDKQQEAGAEYQRAVSAQIERLVAEQVALTVALDYATRRAAQRVAWEANIDLHLLPGGSEVGQDFTALIAEKLTAIWVLPISATQEENQR